MGISMVSAFGRFGLALKDCEVMVGYLGRCCVDRVSSGGWVCVDTGGFGGLGCAVALIGWLWL